MLGPIKSNDQYESYLERVYDLMQLQLEPNSPESDELEWLSFIIEDYGVKKN